MSPGSEAVRTASRPIPASDFPGGHRSPLFLGLAALVLLYAFLAGLRTVTDYDLGWQLATGRWVAQHHSVPSTDVFSYTAAGRPWIYPVGSGLVFYALFLLGGYALLSWAGAVACSGAVALLLRRGTALTAAIAVAAIPRIAARTTPRADLFTVVLFAAFLSLLWEQHQTGRARLWVLPLLMFLWVNLHLGFVAGLALMAAYVLLELETILLHSQQGPAAVLRLRRFWPWGAATALATLLNPWAWNIYIALFRQEKAMAAHAQWISEWAIQPLAWDGVFGSFSVLAVQMVVAVLAAVSFVLFSRRLVPAVMLLSGIYIAIRHVRMQALFACLVVILAASAFEPAIALLKRRIAGEKMRVILAAPVAALCVFIATSSVSLVNNRYYLGRTNTANFGAGLSWWFPERAAEFVEQNSIPGNILNLYNVGGYFTWRLGPKYRDYVDGRAIPFGEERFLRLDQLMHSEPDSAEWQKEAERYGINALLVPLARYDGLSLFPGLHRFCSSQQWRPIFMDEVSAVFVRNTPANQPLIERFAVECGSVPLPAAVSQDPTQAFNQLANAAGILFEVGRRREALEASTRALNIFPDSAILHFVRAKCYAGSGMPKQAEGDYLAAAELEPNDAVFSELAQLYADEGRPELALHTLEKAARLSRQPYHNLLTLGEAYLQASRPREALRFLDQAESKAPADLAASEANQVFRLRLAMARADAYSQLGERQRARVYEEEALRLRRSQPQGAPSSGTPPSP